MLLNLIHRKKVIAGLTLVISAFAVGTLWIKREDSAEQGIANTRSTSRAITPASDREQFDRSQRPSRSTSIINDGGREEHLPRRIQRARGADSSIIAHGSAASVARQKNSQRRVNPSNSTNRISAILGGSTHTARQRVASLEELGSRALSQEEIDAAYEFLMNTSPIEGISESSLHWVVDELIIALRQNGANNIELTRQLAEVYQNHSDMVVRDYALQHLGHIRSEGGETALIDSTLIVATSEQTGTLAGTALLALNAQSQNDSSLVKVTQEKAVTVASNADFDLRSRISALQIAGRQGSEDILPLATNIAANDNEPVSLRISAIATLADLQAVDQQPLLENLSKSLDFRLRTAATAAVAKLATSGQE